MGLLRWIREKFLCDDWRDVGEIVDDLEETLDELDVADSEVPRDELIVQLRDRMQAIRDSLDERV